MSKDVSFSFDQELYFMSLKIKVGIMENLDLLEFSVPVMPSCIPVHDYFFHQNSS